MNEIMRRKLFLVMVLSAFLSVGATAQTVRNASNATIGKIESNGTVRNSSNATIGYARGIKKEWAAVFFFFGMF